MYPLCCVGSNVVFSFAVRAVIALLWKEPSFPSTTLAFRFCRYVRKGQVVVFHSVGKLPWVDPHYCALSFGFSLCLDNTCCDFHCLVASDRQESPIAVGFTQSFIGRPMC